MRNILKCQDCGKYTMKDSCVCNGKALTPKPAKFSIEDKYGSYRRKAKLEAFKKERLI
ncbi:ribosome biogenesis protein [Candidatus Woesearchaeota archaeon]|jgi:H/ACA ribonucleoprotein complex subunit 3|nr:ribosome biogenesis protein [Candidatus Woesearchaeota archaeon]|tara:strand:- start:1679 stop:1852 length:174 start_codon:yes stop_codon:yes gene_type:complete